MSKAPDIQPSYYKTPENVIAIMSERIEGDTPSLDTQADVDRVALEWLTFYTPDFDRFAQMIRDRKVRAEPRWHDDGCVLEIALVRINEAMR